MLRRTWRATQKNLVEFAGPVGAVFTDSFQASTVFTIMMLT